MKKTWIFVLFLTLNISVPVLAFTQATTSIRNSTTDDTGDIFITLRDPDTGNIIGQSKGIRISPGNSIDNQIWVKQENGYHDKFYTIEISSEAEMYIKVVYGELVLNKTHREINVRKCNKWACAADVTVT